MIRCYPLAYGQTLCGHESVPFFFNRFLTSRFVAKATVQNGRADAFTAVMLWMESFRQNPAGTLPNDDVQLARLAGFGGDLEAWGKARAGALYGWRQTHVLGGNHSTSSFLSHPVIEEVIREIAMQTPNTIQGLIEKAVQE